jgi:hypothetical protein
MRSFSIRPPNPLQASQGVLVMVIFCCLQASCVPAPFREYYFSEISGTVMYEGTPLEGARIVRRYQYGGVRGQDAVVTGADGRFHFDHASRYRLMHASQQVIIRQEVTIQHEQREYLGWRYTKLNLDEFGESGGVPLWLSCALDRSPEARSLPHGALTANKMVGVCQAQPVQ